MVERLFEQRVSVGRAEQREPRQLFCQLPAGARVARPGLRIKPPNHQTHAPLRVARCDLFCGALNVA